jgi:hypothetical protein
MAQRENLRASDSDRQDAVERLRVAHDEGRLKLLEYDSRVAAAYEAVTYADLAALFADLPAGSVAMPAPPGAPAIPAARSRRGFFAHTPGWVKIVWASWGTVLLINMLVFVLIDFGAQGKEYFWPIWLAIPTMVIGGMHVIATSVVRSNRLAIEGRQHAAIDARRG